MPEYWKKSKEDLIRLLEDLQEKLRGIEAEGDPRRLLHELQVHQVELEMQNRELRESRAEIEEARDRYAELYDFAPTGYATLDERGAVLEINLAGAAMLGQERGRIVGFPFRNFVLQSDGKIFYEHLRRCRETRRRIYDVITLLKRTGERVHAELQSVAAEDVTTGKSVIRTALIDITERRKTEQRLQELALAIEQSPSMVLIGAIDGSIEYSNPRFMEITGYEHSEVVGMNISILKCPVHSDAFYNQIWSVVAAGNVWRGDMCITRKDGSSFWQLASIAPLRVFGAKVTHFIHVEIDDTERRKAEAALAEEKERLSVILQSIGEGVITLDNEGRVSFINKEGERITGWPREEVLGRHLSEIMNLVRERDRMRYDDPARVFLQMSEDAGAFERLMLIARNGQEKTIAGEMELIRSNDNRVAGMVLVFRDVTEQSKFADELLKIQKLESVTVLSRGLAAEFNRLLNLLKGNIELAVDSIPPGDARVRLREAEKIINMTRDLSHQLMTFSSGKGPVKEPLYLDRMLREITDFVLSDTPVTYEISIPEDLWFVDADEEQIGQVFRNVLLNAVQSMPEGGRIRIECENIQSDESSKYQLARGRYERISIKDTGSGIARELLPKIFDPFFTTKEKGRGLGLTIAHSIIRKHGGVITVESTPGAGTTVNIFLPAPERHQRKPAA